MYRSTVPAYHSFQVVLLIAANSAQAIPTHRHVQRREAGQSSRAEKLVMLEKGVTYAP